MSSAIASKRRGPIYALISGDFVSQFGNAVTTIALPWFVLESTGSATLTGIVFIALFLPVPIVTFFGGAVVDRVSRVKLSIAADLVSGVSVALIPLLHHTIGIRYWQLLILVFLGAVLDGPGFAARRSLVPDLAEGTGMSLERANSAFQVSWSTSVLLGPALGGVLIALVGSTAALWFDAGTFLVSALLIAFFIKDERAESIIDKTDGNESPSYLREVWEGVQWIVADRRLTQVLVSASITMTLIAAYMVIIMPVYAEAVFDDPVSLGILVAGFGLGSLLGSIGFGYLANRLASWTTYLIATALVGVPFVLLAMEPSLVIATILGCLVGIVFGPIIPSMDTLIQQRTDDSIRGRVFCTRFALNNIIKLPGLLFIGVALESRGIAPTLIVLGIVSLAMVAYLAVRRTNDQVALDLFNSQAIVGREPSQTS